MAKRTRTLSHQIEAIEYVHADDGLPYRHDFTRGDSDIQLRDDGSVVIRNRGKRALWDEFTVKGKSQPFLVNPSGKRDTSTRRKTKMATKRRKSSKRRRNPVAARKPAAPRRRRRRANGYSMATNPPARRRRRHHRRNPPFNVNSILRSTTEGLMDAGFVVAGKTLARLVSAQLPYEDGSMMDSLVEVAAGVGIALIAPRFLGADRARFMVAGAFASPMETMIAQANIPQVSQLLGKTAGVGASTSVVYPAADTTVQRTRGGVHGYSGANQSWPRFGAYNGQGNSSTPSATVLQSQNG